ncbi:hypothetical protein ACPCSE_29465 [Streptomyces cellulosae]
MPSSTAAPSRPPRPQGEKHRHFDIQGYTFPLEQAREWLGCDPTTWADLLKRSKRNARRGLNKPLVLVDGGQSVTLDSVFSCRRLLAASTR